MATVSPGVNRFLFRSPLFLTLFLSVLLVFSCSPPERYPETEQDQSTNPAIPDILAKSIARATPGSQGGPSRVWTDVPELVLATELFNRSQTRSRIEIEYHPNLSVALKALKSPTFPKSGSSGSSRTRDGEPALVIGRHIAGKALLDSYQVLDYLFSEFYITKSAFYPELLDLGSFGGRQLLLPVSFNLPAIIFAKGTWTAPDAHEVDLEAMRVAAREFNTIKSGHYSRMGFSPLWNPDFLSVAARVSGAAFSGSDSLVWNSDGLGSTVRMLRAWSREINTSGSAEREFEFKYLFIPDYRSLAEGRTRFAYMDSTRLFTLPPEVRDQLDFRWFSDGSFIPVDEDMVFAAILRTGKGKGGAEAFLHWLFKEENQKKILDMAAATAARESAFGVAGGFSSLRGVNERILPSFYPELSGKIPRRGRLSAPVLMPENWTALRKDVIIPWLYQHSTASAENGNTDADLSGAIAKWLAEATIDRELY